MGVKIDFDLSEFSSKNYDRTMKCGLLQSVGTILNLVWTHFHSPRRFSTLFSAESRIFYLPNNTDFCNFFEKIEKSLKNRFQSRSKVRNGQTGCFSTTFFEKSMPDEEIIRDDEFFQFSPIFFPFLAFSLAFYAILSSKRVFFASNTF